MLAMVSMRSPCKPEIEHEVLIKKKKRKLSKSPSGVIDDWTSGEQKFSPSVESTSIERKRTRDLPWQMSSTKAREEVVKPRTPPAAIVEKRADLLPSGADTTGSDSDSSSCSSSSDESDTDEEEIMMWAHKMFGCPLRPPPALKQQTNVPAMNANSGSLKITRVPPREKQQTNGTGSDKPIRPLKIIHVPPLPQTITPQFQSNADAEARARRKKAKKERKQALLTISEEETRDEDCHPIARKKKKKQPFVLPPLEECEKFDVEQERKNMEEERRKREMAKPLTMQQIREILGEDDFMNPGHENWVRRSVRRPCKALLNSKPVRSLVHMLKTNHPEMAVLKMKKYINDPDAPQVVLDAALEALEENTNCEALFIQNFNEGMRDNQILHLLRILQQPSCNIWCLNVGETYNVDTETWEKFTKGLRYTKVTHMYASEHTITTEMKDEIRATIRENRSKHDRHINPDNLDVIVQCTHCWWNPINAKRLRPYLKKNGYEHMLNDKEAQGMKGSTSAAPST